MKVKAVAAADVTVFFAVVVADLFEKKMWNHKVYYEDCFLSLNRWLENKLMNLFCFDLFLCISRMDLSEIKFFLLLYFFLF